MLNEVLLVVHSLQCLNRRLSRWSRGDHGLFVSIELAGIAKVLAQLLVKDGEYQIPSKVWYCLRYNTVEGSYMTWKAHLMRHLNVADIAGMGRGVLAESVNSYEMERQRACHGHKAGILAHYARLHPQMGQPAVPTRTVNWILTTVLLDYRCRVMIRCAHLPEI